ncbi:unnamed protein product [Caenorhabditis angaria]|uniref:Seven TM Receptor n=1 Tax=Caenorhabditis angaria TaxID=860376 RepID=A0A9P1IPA3_9PELO|nr:unnamed protein product [Caenorhabditis angaria]
MAGNFDNILKTIQKICLALSYILNIQLIFLILFKSPKSFGSYRVLMIYISVTNVIYSNSIIFVSPTIHSFESSYAAFININNTLLKNREVIRILLDAWCAMFGTFMGMFALQYIYRYFVIMNNTKMLNTFNSYKIIIWMSLPLIYMTVWGTVCYYYFAPNSEFTEYLRQNILNVYGFQMDDVVYVGVHLYSTDKYGKTIIDWDAIIGVIIIWAFLMSSLIIIIYFGVSCHSKIKKKSNAGSRKNTNFQMRVFTSLVVQTLVPVFLMHTPVSVIFLFAFLQFDTTILTFLVVIAVAIFPVVNPIPIMLIIPDYRFAIFKCCRRDMNQKQINSITVHHLTAPPSKITANEDNS